MQLDVDVYGEVGAIPDDSEQSDDVYSEVQDTTARPVFATTDQWQPLEPGSGMYYEQTAPTANTADSPVPAARKTVDPAAVARKTVDPAAVARKVIDSPATGSVLYVNTEGVGNASAAAVYSSAHEISARKKQAKGTREDARSYENISPQTNASLASHGGDAERTKALHGGDAQRTTEHQVLYLLLIIPHPIIANFPTPSLLCQC